jgi:hypothetical protein
MKFTRSTLSVPIPVGPKVTTGTNSYPRDFMMDALSAIRKGHVPKALYTLR